MGEIHESNNNVVNELKRINKRLDSIFSWMAAFIVIIVVLWLISFWFMFWGII